MAFAESGTIRIAGGVLVGGLLTGMLLAMTTPTQMTRKAETWRDMIGLREIAVSETTIPVYAPPQDLTPVSWQTAADEYPSLSSEGTALESVYPASSLSDADIADPSASDQVDPPYEPLPAELMRSNDVTVASADDDAASSAQAASAAAEEVQVQAEDSTSSAPPAVVPPSTTDAA